jgi:hypothetical protein
MKLVEFRVIVPSKEAYKTWHLYACGDWHLGAKNCDEKLLDATLKAVAKDKYGLFLGMGDAAECITPADPRFDARSIAPQYLPELEDIAGAQFKDIKKKLEPLAKQGKIIGLMDGNHEDNIRKRHYRHLTLDLCRELDVNYLTYSCMIRLVFDWRYPKDLEAGKHTKNGPSKKYIIRATHGHTGGRKKGGQLNNLNDLLAHWGADIFLKGHSHRLIADQISRIRMSEAGKTRLIQDTHVMGVTGCYYKTYEQDTDCYAELADYPPSELGCIRVNMAPFATKNIDGKQVRVGQLSIGAFIP